MPETSQQGRLATSIPFPAIITVLIFYYVFLSNLFPFQGIVALLK